MEWDYSGRKGRDGQKKKIGKANERKKKVKGGKYEEVNGQGGKRGAPAPHGANVAADVPTVGQIPTTDSKMFTREALRVASKYFSCCNKIWRLSGVTFTSTLSADTTRLQSELVCT